MKLQKLNKSYFVLADNGKEIGSFQLDIDGYYYFWENSELTGCWTGNNLREIAELLDEVNKPFDEQVKEYFTKLKEKQSDCEHNMVQDSDWDGHLENNQTCSKCGYTNY